MAEKMTCANCGHTDPHDGPAGDVADACTHPMCRCGFFQPAPSPVRASAQEPEPRCPKCGSADGSLGTSYAYFVCGKCGRIQYWTETHQHPSDLKPSMPWEYAIFKSPWGAARRLLELTRPKEGQPTVAQCAALIAVAQDAAAEARGRQQAEQKLEHWKRLGESVRIEQEQLEALAAELGVSVPTDKQGYEGKHTAFTVINHLKERVQQAEQARDCQTSDGLYHCRHDVLCQACQLRHANERVAALTQALKDYRAEHKGCRSAVWGDNRCELCKQTDAALTGAQVPAPPAEEKA